MHRRKMFSLAALTILTLLLSSVALAQQAAPATAKAMKKDEMFFSIARRLNAINESPVSAIVSQLDGMIEITSITMRPDGKAEVLIKERTPSSAAYTNKSTRLVFTPPTEGDKWTWESFEENRRFYPVEKLFPYAKDELTKRQQLTNAKWTALLAAINKQGEAANKTLDTAKAILKGDPPPLIAIVTARKNLAEAAKENNLENILIAYGELAQQTEAVTTLGDNYPDLKANDAYLRLLEEFKNTVNVTKAARRDYLQSVDAYNEVLLRLPFTLVAYGLQFTKIEPKLPAE
jgi:LemA protein